MRGMLVKGESNFGPVDLNAVVREVSALTQADANCKGIEITLALAPDLPPVRGDRIQLQQVVLNLIVNAMDAMSTVEEAERELVVETKVDEDLGGILLAVCDTGPGVDPQELEKVFSAFYTTKPEGMGMGLAISRSIIKEHGGRLWARANDERGATFQFTLPARNAMPS